ncbi:unnamed protein product [Ambrosiozyma monospora]|uniref:Unnamed protein product n=1 Tax=Ambrosiozyma monospora TaxID=43982 RepID=A0A9W7DGT9_AMBMO|nr:unnamed protein product [Ambrosiozyma monospora]
MMNQVVINSVVPIGAPNLITTPVSESTAAQFNGVAPKTESSSNTASLIAIAQNAEAVLENDTPASATPTPIENSNGNSVTTDQKLTPEPIPQEQQVIQADEPAAQVLGKTESSAPAPPSAPVPAPALAAVKQAEEAVSQQ